MNRQGENSRVSGTFAAVDLGSNSFHMIVARHDSAGVEVFDRLREPVRIGAGLMPGQALDPVAVERALAALASFGKRLDELPDCRVRAVATNALRLAGDANEFIARAVTALGHPIDIITGEEEAGLIYIGVSRFLGARPRKMLVFDIGGGSTELVVGHGLDAHLLHSVQVGCVSFTDRFFPSRQVDADSMQCARMAAREAVEEYVAGLIAHGWERAFGTSGALGTLADLCETHGGEQGRISLPALAALKQQLLELRDFDRFASLGITPDRAEVLAAGLCIAEGVLEALGLEQVDVVDAAIREGLLYQVIDGSREEFSATAGSQGR